MIDPRFANVGAVPLVPGYGAQQVPQQYHHHHHHHRHHKHKARNDESPISLDESIHKVDHGQHHHFQQNDGVPFGSGYGVPYGAAGFGAGFQQQQQYGGANLGYANQYQSVPYGQGPFVGGPVDQPVKHHRRHHRHHRHHTTEAANTAAAGVDQAQAVPEQLIGQRSSSVLANEQQAVRSPGPPPPEGAASGDPVHHRRHHRHHHHRHHHSGEQAAFGQTHQSRLTQGHTSVSADGYGHINDDLIFIERGDHSPHRQEPPPGYEYKGKIEVQGLDREYRSRSQGQGLVVQPSVPIPQPVAPAPSLGPCPPGWQQVALTAAPGGPCPPGGLPYTGHVVGSAGFAQTGIGGFSGVGPIGVAGSGAGYANLGAGVPYSSQCQMIADYIFGSQTGASGYTTGYQQSTGTGVVEQFQHEQGEERVSDRATIIEVWQKRAKIETHERSPSHERSRTPTVQATFNFEQFRGEILAAIERIIQRPPTEVQWPARDVVTQTQVQHERRETPGEVRVIVQPIQPVFYMPQQTTPTTAPQVGPVPIIQQTSSAPNVVYVPRNVYVPVIKPVFVPRERVIIRPQVIHVARPVLVDRPVPVTQRPIIIDRERPIPVPVRGGQAAAQTGGSKVVREEYVYRDNLPVAYGGRCAEFAGGVNYGYMPTQQEHQYATSSTQETANIYQTQGPSINVNVPTQFQHSQSASHFDVQQGGGGSFHGSYPNLAGIDYSQAAAAQQGQQYATSSTREGSIVNVNIPNQFQQNHSAGGSFHESYSNLAETNITAGSVLRPSQIEVLDTAVNPYWQKTDQPTLFRRYGRPAYEIVHKSEEVEQQMYTELRQRTSSGGVVRSASTASYVSGSGIEVSGSGIAQY